jgi:hypothetical protein
VTWFDSIHVNGDVTVPMDCDVVIEPGTRVEFFTGDCLSTGQDSTRSELVLTGLPEGRCQLGEKPRQANLSPGRVTDER